MWHASSAQDSREPCRGAGVRARKGKGEWERGIGLGGDRIKIAKTCIYLVTWSLVVVHHRGDAEEKNMLAGNLCRVAYRRRPCPSSRREHPQRGLLRRRSHTEGLPLNRQTTL